MEGYLKYHTKSLFKSAKKERIWAVLDKQHLTLYKKLDLKTQMAIDVKCVISIKDAVIEKMNSTSLKIQHGLLIKPATNVDGTIAKKSSKYLFDCMENDNCSNWFNSLKKAKIIHINEDEEIANRINYCNILEISPDTELNIKTISRAYKKLSLKMHPDKGGNVDQFSLINAAYTSLIAYQTELNDKKTSVIMEYDVVVEKIGNGIGLGIVVYEDKLRKEVVVQSVHDEIKIISLSDDSGGKILEGDTIVSIDNDDCSHWFLSRVKARLSNYRVPIGGHVRFVFERRIKNGDDIESDFNTDSYCTTPNISPLKPNNDIINNSYSNDYSNVDEYAYTDNDHENNVDIDGYIEDQGGKNNDIDDNDFEEDDINLYCDNDNGNSGFIDIDKLMKVDYGGDNSINNKFINEIKRLREENMKLKENVNQVNTNNANKSDENIFHETNNTTNDNLIFLSNATMIQNNTVKLSSFDRFINIRNVYFDQEEKLFNIERSLKEFLAKDHL